MSPAWSSDDAATNWKPEAMLSTPIPAPQGRSGLVSRNVTVEGHRTSTRLEPDMWLALGDICKRERTNVHEVCTAVAERKHADSSLTAAIRVLSWRIFVWWRPTMAIAAPVTELACHFVFRP
jgi:predicted DNA-binding ribbon-helix-helix protein